MISSEIQKHDVLLVEDDECVGEYTASALECFEFKVKHLKNADECFQAVKQKEPSVILLDLELPGLLGHEICSILRKSNFQRVPIIALSGCQDDDAIVRVLESGADDFVAKSQAIPILVAHMRAVLKRGERLLKPPEPSQKITWGPIQIDRVSWRVLIEGREVSLTPTALRLLEIFISSPGAVFTRGQLIDRLHGGGYAVTARTIDVHINTLRNSLGEFKNAVETIRGVGYRFAEDPKSL